jgi:hypothetical protein
MQVAHNYAAANRMKIPDSRQKNQSCWKKIVLWVHDASQQIKSEKARGYKPFLGYSFQHVHVTFEHEILEKHEFPQDEI